MNRLSDADQSVLIAMADQRDSVIAERLSVSTRTVQRWRRRLGLPGSGSFPQPLQHGASAYSHGKCKCDECTEANRVRHAQWRESLKDIDDVVVERLIAGEEVATANRYERQAAVAALKRQKRPRRP